MLLAPPSRGGLRATPCMASCRCLLCFCDWSRVLFSLFFLFIRVSHGLPRPFPLSCFLPFPSFYLHACAEDNLIRGLVFFVFVFHPRFSVFLVARCLGVRSFVRSFVRSCGPELGVFFSSASGGASGPWEEELVHRPPPRRIIAT